MYNNRIFINMKKNITEIEMLDENLPGVGDGNPKIKKLDPYKDNTKTEKVVADKYNQKTSNDKVGDEFGNNFNDTIIQTNKLHKGPKADVVYNQDINETIIDQHYNSNDTTTMNQHNISTLDEVTDQVIIDDNKYLMSGDYNTYAFLYINDELQIQPQSFHHKLIANYNRKHNSHINKDETNYDGRIWLEDEVISFWKFPENQNKLIQIIKDISEAIGVYINPRKISVDVYDTKNFMKEYEKKARLIPVYEYDMYTGNIGPDVNNSNRHKASPMNKDNQEVPDGIGSKKDVPGYGQSNAEKRFASSMDETKTLRTLGHARKAGQGAIYPKAAIKANPNRFRPYTRARMGLHEETRLKQEIQIPSDIIQINNAFKKAGKKLYLVGGAVRDAILGNEPKDFDLATNALPDEVIQIAKDNNFSVTDEVGKDFGVVIINGYEVATFRKDEYYDGSTLESFLKYLKDKDITKYNEFKEKINMK